ncbi:MAG: hypothetical protein V1790_05485 [Planctomycetota bacterium]
MCSPTFQRRIAALVVCLAPTLVFAGQLPARFTLGQYVPDNAWFYVHAADNPDRAWVEQQWAEVFDALKNSGIDRDITSLVMSALTDEDRAKVDAAIQKVTSLIRGVNWGDLAKHEFLFAEGISPSPYGYGYVAMVRGAENSGGPNAAGLVAILKEIVALSPEHLRLSESKMRDADVWSLQIIAQKPSDPVMVFDLFRRGEVIGLVFDLRMSHEAPSPTRQSLQDILGLMAGDGGKKSMMANSRFQDALALVKPPQDVVTFFDAKTLLTDLNGIFDGLGRKLTAKKAAAKKEVAVKENAPADAAGKPCEAADEDDDAKAMAVVQKVLALCNILDYSITTVETRGRRELTHVATRIQSGKESCPLANACLLRKPFDRFDQFIPADATGFSLNGFIDLGGLYNLAVDFVSKEIPKGDEVIAQIKGKFAELGFDPQRDLFDWWSGEMIQVELPAAVVTPMGGADSVLMIRVKNAELASQKVNGAIDFISGTMQKKGQMLMVTPAKVNAEGFREITHPIFAMIARPVVGVYGDWLIVGKSASAVNKCLDVASGKAPSIRENKRFREEGLVPTGAVAGASFKDTSKFGQELAAGIGMIGMFGGMATAMIPDEPETHKVKQIVQSALTIVLKLGPILQKIDFYSSESSMTTYDGPLTVRQESVVTYKEHSTDEPGTAKAPTPPPPPTPPEPPKPPRP